jgi:MerR family transcriptional regulator, light-induced transcriptional regulator
VSSPADPARLPLEAPGHADAGRLDEDQIPRHRSSAAARMAGLPVSTLRIWEQRYRVVAPPISAAGHRLYSLLDVQRLRLLRLLVGEGHAIGSIAGLPRARLDELASRSGVTLSGAPSPRPEAARPLSVVVVGRALAQRLLAGVLRRPGLGGRVDLVAVHGDLYEAQAQGKGQPVDLLLVHLGSLHVEAVERVGAVARRLNAGAVSVLYGFGPEHAADALRAAGAIVRRETLSDHELGVLIASTSTLLAERAPSVVESHPTGPVPQQRRFDEDTLIRIAAMSATIACECPRHLAGLVMELATFEQYSAECSSRNATDAALHLYLHQVAASARTMFEQALERVAMAEGIALPARETAPA